MRDKLNRHRPLNMHKFPNEVEILFDRNVFPYIVEELRKHPSVEEGGKYIGYVYKPGELTLQKFDVNARAQAIVITDFLPSGPKAVRTAVEFMPDGDYQEILFRRAEKLDAAIEHVGTWHSHHCNGLQTLSLGDTEGYFRTVNKTRYRPDFFLASLVKDIPTNPENPDWIDHFLFVRGVGEYYLATDHVRVIDSPTIFGTHTGHGQLQQTVTSSDAHVTVNTLQKGMSSAWYDTDEGRNALAEDRRFFREQFGTKVIATRRDSRITLTGETKNGKAVSVTYPLNPRDKEVSIVVLHHGDAILHMHCELSHRKISFAAARAALCN